MLFSHTELLSESVLSTFPWYEKSCAEMSRQTPALPPLRLAITARKEPIKTPADVAVNPPTVNMDTPLQYFSRADFALLGIGRAWEMNLSCNAKNNCNAASGSTEIDQEISLAQQEWLKLTRNAKIVNQTSTKAHPSPGLIAFTSFSFQPFSSKTEKTSILLVPQIMVVADGKDFWLTINYRQASKDQDNTGNLQDVDPKVLNPLRQRALQILRSCTRAPIKPLPVTLASSKTTKREQWQEAFNEIRKELSGPQLEKVVLARSEDYRIDSSHIEHSQYFDKNPLATDSIVTNLIDETAMQLSATLQSSYPNCWIFCVSGLVGATPEMLIEVQGSQAHCRVLAGTAPKNASKRLLTSEKERTEHQIAVHSVTEPLKELCGNNAVETSQPYVLELPNVTHLATEVYVKLSVENQPYQPKNRGERQDALSLAARLHPTAAVCGQPRHAAAELITQVEKTSRGRYAAPVGWIDHRGNGQLALALRCAQLKGTQLKEHSQKEPQRTNCSPTKTVTHQTQTPDLILRAYAGGGIMPDSQADAEWAETENKLAPIRKALAIKPAN